MNYILINYQQIYSNLIAKRKKCRISDRLYYCVHFLLPFFKGSSKVSKYLHLFWAVIEDTLSHAFTIYDNSFSILNLNHFQKNQIDTLVIMVARLHNLKFFISYSIHFSYHWILYHDEIKAFYSFFFRDLKCDRIMPSWCVWVFSFKFSLM